TVTHGGMVIGAGTVAAERLGANSIVNPHPYAVGKIIDTYEKYPHVGKILPAMGYGKEQLKDLETTINNADCDTVIIGTPIDLSRIITINKPTTRVHYELNELEGPNLDTILDSFIEKYQLGKN